MRIGVAVTDLLSEAMGLRSNGTEHSEARRNKFAMGEAIRSKGIRAVKQCSATTWKQVVTFIQQELKPNPFKVVVKPEESAGSDDVTLCTSMEEVQIAFGNIQGKINGLGLENMATLVQEYLSGTEYVVDTVSRDGEHKVVAVWEYDKRAVNDAPFVYFGVMLRDGKGPMLESIVDYTISVLDALNIQNGPGHAEVKYVNGEPCLVEIGARCHGGEASYIGIVKDCVGYNQVDVALDSYLDPKAFHAIPARLSGLKKHGCEAMLVSYDEGILEQYAALDEIEAMPSFLKSMIIAKPGDVLHRTIDMFSTPGSVMMVHENANQIKADYDRIRQLEFDGLYDVKPVSEAILQRPTVVLVDPFSTGAVVAQKIVEQGYECVCMYSDSMENLQHVTSLVPEGVELQFVATLEFDGTLAVTFDKLVRLLSSNNLEIVAVIPGAETGVKLADQLADRFLSHHTASLRGNNVFKHASARRDKYDMGETLRKSGLRAVNQFRARNWDEAQQFIVTEIAPTFKDGDLKVVLKPVESAGTDDVVLCNTLDQAQDAVSRIIGKVNGLGLVNTSILVQEYLEGTEYVIDTVSLDGVHKVVAVWEYDKRQVNNAAFVYFGVRIIPASDPNIQELISYQFQVLTALGIRNGPAHGELKYCRGEPVLIEVGSRCHGGEGAWIPIANKCVGYNQVDVMVDALIDPSKFDNLPVVPKELLAHGCEAMLVSYESGVVDSLPGLMEIEHFSSFLKMEIFAKPGSALVPTIDMFTTPGSVMLVHDDKIVLDKHLLRIRELEQSGLYQWRN